MTSAPPELRFGRFVLQAARRRLLVDDRPAELGARAFDLLLALVERRDRVVAKAELLDLVWPGLVVEENNLQVHVSTLRKLLGPLAIATVPGRGYRFTLAVDGTAVGERPAERVVEAKQVAGNLPALPLLFGRDADLAALTTLLRSHRMVTVVGAGGIGKTRLAQAAAHVLRDHFADGAWMIELAPLADPALLPATVAQAIGLSLPGRKDATDELVDALHHRSALLVLDNCEHLIDAASGLVEAIVGRTSGTCVLATSQELLKVGGEHLYRVGPLAVPAAAEPQTAAGFGAVALFVGRASALQPGFALDDSNVADVIEICRRLDGLPLALELAAARVPLLGVAGVRERLDERLRMLTGGARMAPRRHQTLRETLDWSHGLLDDGARTIFRRAGVFVGSFSLPAAQQALADAQVDEWAVLDHLGTLIDKSLLVAETGEPPRYRLLESTRAYALEKLREAGETDAVLRRHAQAMRAQFEISQMQKWTTAAADRLARWLPDLDNLRAALDWAARTDRDAELHIALAGASAWLWRDSGLHAEGLRRCEQAMVHIDGATPPSLEAQLLLEWSALAHPRAGHAERAAAERAVALYRALDDRRGLYQAVSRLAIAAAVGGDAATAEQASAEAQRLHHDDWPPRARWHGLAARSYFLHQAGRFDEAHAVAEQCRLLAVALGDSVLLRMALVNLEQTAAASGRFEEAVTRGQGLVAMLRQDRFATTLPTALFNLGAALTELGRLDEALAAAREAVTLSSPAGTLWNALDPLALLAFKRGRPNEAALALGRAEARQAWRTGRREPNEQRARDQVFALLLRALGESELRRLLAQGATLSDEEAARTAIGD